MGKNNSIEFIVPVSESRCESSFFEVNRNSKWLKEIEAQCIELRVEHNCTPHYLAIGLRELLELNIELNPPLMLINTPPVIIRTAFGTLTIILMGKTHEPKVLGQSGDIKYILKIEASKNTTTI